MNVTFDKISKKPGVLVSMTTLREEEFINLSSYFGSEWDKYIRIYTITGKIRKRPVVKSRENAVFPAIEDMLLFILMYLKTYPLQMVVAAQYGMNQPQVNSWIKLLKKILIQSLEKMGHVPNRDIERLQTLLKDEPKAFHDATDRAVQRSGDYEVQKEYYSGKKNSIR